MGLSRPPFFGADWRWTGQKWVIGLVAWRAHHDERRRIGGKWEGPAFHDASMWYRGQPVYFDAIYGTSE